MLNKKIIGLFCFSFLLINITLGQTYTDPVYEYKPTDGIEVTKIVISKDQTIVYFKLTTPNSFAFGGTACIKRSTYLEDRKTKKRYYLQRVKGLPYCPEQHYLNRPGERVYFRLYFPKLPYNVRNINIIENVSEGEGNPFNFYNIYLKPTA